MGLLPKKDKTHTHRDPGNSSDKMLEVLNTISISVEGMVKYARLTRGQARLCWAGLNIFGKHVALMHDAGGHGIAHKKDNEWAYPDWRGA